MKNTILITGATGYIGSHTWCELLDAGYEVIGLDDLSNSSILVLDRIAAITGKKPIFFQGDVRNTALLEQIFASQEISAIVHFAALKAVGESVVKPLDYYNVNVGGLIALLAAARDANVKRFIFSSSATVYGNPATVPVREDFPVNATNPYGRTKLMSEEILHDMELANPEWQIGYLRYFNPVGAHASGLLGESPKGIPNNLFPYVANVAIGNLGSLKVYGSDYATRDGTGVRDYIHVVDLAQGHVKAIDHVLNGGPSFTVNLGTGMGYSVLEVVRAYEEASGRVVKHELVGRRPGDIAECYADVTLASQLLDWRAKRGLMDMCRDSWRWQTMNPNGLEGI
ncbi:MAG: UDP-glucose 4-epimerase GalE [Oxalicibacterium faecigallinarum]|uniref:UDP-glucose 4-epimerase GalE n=1 Tax=Oxalicibacterium faecigallinarum TaxID=573741 RepID=UPI001667F09B|nr:UDP-glucose 4-epimerase GalE [Oxalicibacterium faecigallinarum]MDQ7969429.1 UDP-glucose 4-epimerase GalE [Oxalicibacterium faecigallinarum]